MKILILASNPRKDLNLDREIRDLKEVIKKSQNRQAFEVEDALAVKVGQLQELLFDHRPQIVHFCGHGSGQQGLVFEGNDGGEQWVRAEALSEMFRLFSSNVGCVLLNACYSEEQANAIVNHIDYVIGMSQAIRDDAAIAFSKGFYRAVGYERSIEEAFEFGKNAIQLEISGSSKMRSVTTEAVRKAEVVNAIQHTEIPEHLKPILKTKPTLTTSSRANITAPEQPLPQETRVAIQLDIDKALETDTKVKQYRDRVREFLGDRKLSALETIRLERLRKDLGLSEAEATQILAEEMEPILKARDDYEAMLIGLIEAGEYPFDPKTEAELQTICQELQLTDEEVEAIKQPIIEAADEDYRGRLKRYEQGIRAALVSHYLLPSSARQSLNQLQRSLMLRYEDVTRIEKSIAALESKAFNFQVPRIEKDCTITYQRGQADYFAEALGGVTLEMVSIADGKFTMGQTEAETQYLTQQFSKEDYQKWFAIELPRHKVSIPSFLMGKYAVTQAQWSVVATDLPKVKIDLNPDPSHFKGADRPVEKVSWDEAVEFCDRLSQKAGKNYRLPSEAEWEYACRAGTTTPFYCGETIATDLANYNGNYTYGSGTKGVYREKTEAVGSFPPNAFGLYDMHGNVWEWCADYGHGNYEGAPIDGSAWIIGGDSDKRLLRGGSWLFIPANCRSCNRLYAAPVDRNYSLGFRVVCGFA